MRHATTSDCVYICLAMLCFVLMIGFLGAVEQNNLELWQGVVLWVASMAGFVGFGLKGGLFDN